MNILFILDFLPGCIQINQIRQFRGLYNLIGLYMTNINRDTHKHDY